MNDLASRLAKLNPRQRAFYEKKLKLAKAAKSRRLTITPRSEFSPVPASVDQTTLWFFQALDPGTTVYNIGGACRMHGKLDLELMQAGFDIMVERHEILRTTLHLEDGRLMQRIAPFRRNPMPLVDFADKPAAAREGLAHSEITRWLKIPFDMEKGPLIKLPVLRLGECDHILLIVMHHSMTDWWSIQLLFRELMTVYKALREGRPNPLPPLPIQFADFAIWRNSWAASPDYQKQMDYWLAQLRGAPLVLDIPTDRTRPAVQTGQGVRSFYKLPAETDQELKKLNRQTQTTNFMTLLAVTFLFASRYTGAKDLLIGTSASNRDVKEAERIIGYLLNTIVLRADLCGDPSFLDFQAEVRKTALAGFANKDLPFMHLVEELNPERDLSRMPLYQIEFIYVTSEGLIFQDQLRDGGNVVVEGLTTSRVEVDRKTSPVDLQIVFLDLMDGITIWIEYNSDIFVQATIDRMADLIMNLLASIVHHPERPVSRLDWLSPEEKARLLDIRGPERVGLPLVRDVLTAQAAKTPRATAVVVPGSAPGAERLFSYQSLQQRSAALAGLLRDRGCVRETVVALLLPRDEFLPIGLLAAIGAGVCYLPLEPSLPAERLSFMLRDAGARMVLTTGKLQAALPQTDIPVILVDDPIAASGPREPDEVPDLAEAAYLIYTSGSTGKPKGVQISHGAAANYLAWLCYQFSPADLKNSLVSTSFSFDIFFTETYLPLARGGALVVIEDLPSLPELSADVSPTFINTTPTAIATLLQYKPLPDTVRTIALIGEPLPPGLAARLYAFPGVRRVFNLYGPTETTVCSSSQRVAVETPDLMSIGRPIFATHFYVLGSNLEPVPYGVRGQLWIAGQGLARCYFNRPDLTAIGFVPDPYSAEPGQRMYGSGDLVRHMADGAIIFDGRIDFQIKLRGYRIEIGEIETLLGRHPRVTGAVVIVRELSNGEDGLNQKRLIAYVTLTESGDDHELTLLLQTHLRSELPVYMVPSAFVFVEEFPRTPAGKVDRAALPVPRMIAPKHHWEAPLGEAEQMLAEIWADVLKLDRVGVTDNFFALGGDSIAVIQITAQAARKGLLFTPPELFRFQTIRLMAPRIRFKKERPQEQKPSVGPVAMTAVWQPWLLDRAVSGPNSLWLEPYIRLEPDRLERALAGLCFFHDSLRLRFSQQDGVWSGFLGDPAQQDGTLFEHVDCRMSTTGETQAKIEARWLAEERVFDLWVGPAIKLILCDRGSGFNQVLLLLLHPLVADPVCLKMLAADLETVYRSDPPDAEDLSKALKQKGLTVDQWAVQRLSRASSQPSERELSRHRMALKSLPQGQGHVSDPTRKAMTTRIDVAREFLERFFTADRNQDLSPWGMATDAAPTALQPPDLPNPNVVVTSLEPELTALALEKALGAYGLEMADLLITAMVLALRDSFPQGLPLWVTGSFRALEGAEALERTCGMFELAFPIRFPPVSERALGECLKGVKEQLRNVPLEGLCSPQAWNTTAEKAAEFPFIAFRYLGNLDRVTEKSSLFNLVRSRLPSPVRKNGRQRDLLVVDAMVWEGKLTLRWNKHGPGIDERVNEWSRNTLDALKDLIDHTLHLDGRGLTPSDYPLARLDQAALDDLLAEIPQLDDIYTATPMQQGMLFQSMKFSHTRMYTEQFAIVLQGQMDGLLFRRAWQKTVARHGALRTTFRDLGGILHQVVLGQAAMDWRTFSSAKDIESLKREDLEETLSLARGVPMRFKLVRLNARPEPEHLFIWTYHHALLDGWSLPLVTGEVGQIYQALLVGHNPELEPAPAFRDYVAWLERQNSRVSADYWRKQLRGFDKPSQLSLGHGKAQAAAGYGQVSKELDRGLTEKLQAFSRENRITLNTLFQGAWALLLGRYGYSRDTMFGVTHSGRPADLPRAEVLVGLLINSLPLRTKIEFRQPLTDWLRGIQDQQIQARTHGHLALTELRGFTDLAPGQALFESILIFENLPAEAVAQGGLGPLKLSRGSAFEMVDTPLALVIRPGRVLRTEIKYDPQAFCDRRVTEILGVLHFILASFAEHPQARLGDLPVNNPREREQLERWECPASRHPYQLGHVLSLLEKQMAADPNRPALIGREQVWTYGELKRCIDRLANFLRTQGARSETVIAIAMPRGFNLVVSIFAVLKVGAVFLPLDPDYPVARLRYILTDSGASMVLVENRGGLSIEAEALRLVDVSTWDQPNWDSDRSYPPPPTSQLAYMIYTSGSTGRPKGVMISHGALRHYVDWCLDRYLKEGRGALLHSSPAFDLTLTSILTPILGGKAIVLAPEEPGGGGLATGLGLQRDYSYLKLTPSHLDWLNQRLSAEELGGLTRALVVGGEALFGHHLELWRQNAPATELINEYGPTEATVGCAVFQSRLGDLTLEEAAVPIGLPIDRMALFLLDASLSRLPRGMVGEIFIGGMGLARGYSGKPAETASRFVPHPFSREPGARLYRSGDLARRREDGRLVFLGRVDQQMKLRGFRIELGEIEAVLSRHDSIAEAVVTARHRQTSGQDAAGPEIACFFAPATGSEPHIEVLRDYLKQHLPAYMVPTSFQEVAGIPLTTHGKRDLKALYAMAPAAVSKAFSAPRTPIEKAVIASWQEVLNLPQIGLNDHFFDLGGHSLMVTRMIARLRDSLKIELPYTSLFEYPVAADLARFIEVHQWSVGSDSPDTDDEFEEEGLI